MSAGERDVGKRDTGEPPLLASRILGREREQRRLLELLRCGESGAGASLVITGEPGVGKSVLLSFARETARPSVTVLSAVGAESESELPFAGLATLLRPVVSALDELPDPQAAALRSAIGLGATQPVEPLAVYFAFVELISRLARERPVLVLVDDLHWLDGASRDAIVFLARRLSGEAIVVLGGVRTGEGASIDPESIPRLELAGLDEESAVRLLGEARPGIAANVASQLWAGTEGNPLALVEIVRLLSDGQISGRDPLDERLPVGRRLEQLFARRLSGLPDDTRKLLLLTAASHTGAIAVLAGAAQSLDLELDALAQAENAGLIEIKDGSLGWRHPLLRSATYHSASVAQRRAAHRALAQAGGPERLDDHRAWHLAAAAIAADEDVAGELELLAGRARERGALSSVVRALRQAAALTPDDESRARRLIAAGEAATAIGRSDEAAAILSDAVRRTDDRIVRAQAERVRARVDILRGVPDAARQRLVTLAESLSEIAPELAAVMMAEALVADMATGRWQRYFQTAERALELGRRVGGASEAVAGLMLGCVLIAQGRPAEGIPLFEEYERLVWEPSLWQTGPELVGMYAFCNTWIERWDVAERLLVAMIDSARRTGAIRALAFPLCVNANLNFRRGRWPTALAQATEAVTIARAMPEGALLANNLAHLACVEAGLGRGDAARTHASECLKLARSLSLGAILPHAVHALALLDLSEGNYQAVIGHVESLDPDVSAGENEPGHMLWIPIVIEAHIRSGQVLEAKAKLADYEHWCQATGRTFGHACAERCHGLLASDSAFEEHFERALDWHRQLDTPFDIARTRLCYGERLRRIQQRKAAREQLTPAVEHFRALGADTWSKRAQNELEAAGTRKQKTAGESMWSALTSQEARTVRLIIEGATYQEAADELFLSPRTVESHLRKAYRKLGVRSRTELTRALSQAPTPD
jgi:DNA-binding CsgD family transcriptional regulator